MIEEYVIEIDTSKFQPQELGNTNSLIANAICVALNEQKWVYKTEKGLRNRLAFLTKRSNTNLSSRSKANNMVIQDSKLGKLKVKIALPGICSGFVDLDKVISKLNTNKMVELSFSSFYDTESLDEFIEMDNCYIKIRKI
jgi:hypothetical protein